jgi:hypothetical protein
VAGWGIGLWGETTWGAGGGSQHIPTSPEFTSADVSNIQLASFLDYIEVQATNGLPWISYDSIAQRLTFSSNATTTTAAEILVPTSDNWTFEINFQPIKLPATFNDLTHSRLFFGAFNAQGLGGGIAVSREGVALVDTFSGQAYAIAGSQNLISEGTDYYTIRIAVVDGMMNIYITRTDMIAEHGQMLRYTVHASMSPSDVSDGTLIDLQGDPTENVTVVFQAIRFNGNEGLLPNKRPIAVPNGDQSLSLHSTAEYDGTRSYDPEGQALSYKWALIGAPDGSVFKVTGTGWHPPSHWSYTGGTEYFRYWPTQVRLSDGRVLIAGGDYGGANNLAQVYDPATGLAPLTGVMNSNKVFALSARMADGKVFITEGTTNDHGNPYVTSYVEVYDPVAGTFTVVGTFSRARGKGFAVLLDDGTVLFGGGYTDNYIPQDVWSYTTGFLPVAKASMPLDAYAGVKLHNGKVFTVPWTDGSYAQLYDPLTDAWTALGTQPLPGIAEIVLLLDGRVLITGGNSAQSACFLYDPNTNVVSSTATLNTPRWVHALILLGDGRALAAGGLWTTNSAEIYDPSTEQWTVTDNLDNGRFGTSGCALLDGRAFIAGGYGGAHSELYSTTANPYLFISSVTDVFSATNAPLLQPGDTLVLGDGSVYTVAVGSPAMWEITPTSNGKYVRKPGVWLDDRIATVEPIFSTNQYWALYYSVAYFNDYTSPRTYAIPDIAGIYKTQLTVNDGVLDSIPVWSLTEVASTVVTFGVIPDVSWIWNHLTDFMNMLEDRESVEKVWSGFAQGAANVLLTAWQIDYSKSLKDIQRVFQKRWISYDLLCAQEPDAPLDFQDYLTGRVLVTLSVPPFSLGIQGGDSARFVVTDKSTGFTRKVWCQIWNDDIGNNTMEVVAYGLYLAWGGSFTAWPLQIGQPENFTTVFDGVIRREYIPVDKSIVSIPRLQEIIVDPPHVLTLHQDYIMTPSTWVPHPAIYFASTPWWTQPWEDPFNELGNYPPDRLWAEVTYVDNNPTIEANFGSLVEVSPTDLSPSPGTNNLDYLSVVRGLWYAYFRGPSLQSVRIGTQILLGLPFAEEDGVVQSIDLTFGVGTGRMLLQDVKDSTIVRSYVFDLIPNVPVIDSVAINVKTGLPIAVGDTVGQFEPLSNGVEVIDYVKTPLWAKAFGSTFPEIRKFFSFMVQANVDTIAQENISFALNFLRKIKPHYTRLLFNLLKNMEPEQIDVSEHQTALVKKRTVTSADTRNIGGYRWDDNIEGTVFDPPNNAICTDGNPFQHYDHTFAGPVIRVRIEIVTPFQATLPLNHSTVMEFGRYQEGVEAELGTIDPTVAGITFQDVNVPCNGEGIIAILRLRSDSGFVSGSMLTAGSAHLTWYLESGEIIDGYVGGDGSPLSDFAYFTGMSLPATAYASTLNVECEVLVPFAASSHHLNIHSFVAFARQFQSYGELGSFDPTTAGISTYQLPTPIVAHGEPIYGLFVLVADGGSAYLDELIAGSLRVTIHFDLTNSVVMTINYTDLIALGHVTSSSFYAGGRLPTGVPGAQFLHDQPFLFPLDRINALVSFTQLPIPLVYEATIQVPDVAYVDEFANGAIQIPKLSLLSNNDYIVMPTGVGTNTITVEIKVNNSFVQTPGTIVADCSGVTHPDDANYTAAIILGTIYANTGIGGTSGGGSDPFNQNLQFPVAGPVGNQPIHFHYALAHGYASGGFRGGITANPHHYQLSNAVYAYTVLGHGGLNVLSNNDSFTLPNGYGTGTLFFEIKKNNTFVQTPGSIVIDGTGVFDVTDAGEISVVIATAIGTYTNLNLGFGSGNHSYVYHGIVYPNPGIIGNLPASATGGFTISNFSHGVDSTLTTDTRFNLHRDGSVSETELGSYDVSTVGSGSVFPVGMILDGSALVWDMHLRNSDLTPAPIISGGQWDSVITFTAGPGPMVNTFYSWMIPNTPDSSGTAWFSLPTDLAHRRLSDMDTIWAYDDGGGADLIPLSGPSSSPPAPHGPLVGIVHYDTQYPDGTYVRQWWL